MAIANFSHSPDQPAVTAEQHRARVVALLADQPAETLPLAQCHGRVLAAELDALVDLPGFANSAMDGYAVRAADTGTAAETAPVRLPVTADIPAGTTGPCPLQHGCAHRIMTGAVLPDGADAVIPVEHTRALGPDPLSDIELTAPAEGGQCVRGRGEELQAGQSILPRGRQLGAAALALAAAAGHAEIAVRRRPRVLVCSTGSELMPLGSPLQAGQIYDSNSEMLLAAVAEAGADPVRMPVAADDVDTFLGGLERWAGSGDLLLTTGGVSAGAYEVVKDALQQRGVSFGPVAIQPGKPQGWGLLQPWQLPVAALPGNPVSALTSFEMFVRPALRAALGCERVERSRAWATLQQDVSSPPGRFQLRRGYWDGLGDGAGLGTVTPSGGSGSHLLGAQAAANCLIEVGSAADHLAAGSLVRVLLTDV